MQQQFPRAWQSGGGSGGGGIKIYYASSDGTAVGTGTWPTFTPGSFISDVYDYSTGAPVLAESSATIYWPYLDALATSGAPVPCVKLDGGGYLGLLEACTTIPDDE